MELLLLISICTALILGMLYLIWLDLKSTLRQTLDNRRHVDAVTLAQETLAKKIDTVQAQILLIHKRIDKIFVVDAPSENEVIKKEEEGIEFSEQNPLTIPKDVKFAVEGGDSVAPGYSESTN